MTGGGNPAQAGIRRVTAPGPARTDTLKHQRFTTERGTRASLLAYFAPIAHVRLDLMLFWHCGSKAERKRSGDRIYGSLGS
jgi:hypothetical protein